MIKCHWQLNCSFPHCSGNCMEKLSRQWKPLAPLATLALIWPLGQRSWGGGGVNEGLWRREKSPVKILFDPLFGDILGQVSHPQMACLSHHSTSKPSVLAPRRPPSPPHVTLLHIAAPKALPALSHQQPCRHWRQGTEPSPPAAPPVPASLLCCWGPAVATHADFSLKKSFFQTSFVSDHKLPFHWRYSNPSLVHILKFHTGNGK